MFNSKVQFKRITDVRYDHGLSVAELSAITGLTEGQINDLENGTDGNAFVEQEHQIDCVKRVAEALGINYDHFFGEIDFYKPDLKNAEDTNQTDKPGEKRQPRFSSKSQ